MKRLLLTASILILVFTISSCSDPKNPRVGDKVHFLMDDTEINRKYGFIKDDEFHVTDYTAEVIKVEKDKTIGWIYIDVKNRSDIDNLRRALFPDDVKKLETHLHWDEHWEIIDRK